MKKPGDFFVGVLAALGISITNGIALPMVNVFDDLTKPELMLVRGGVTAVMMVPIFWQHLGRPSGRMIVFSSLFALATLCLYSGIRIWGPGPTLVVITATPVVNIVAKLLRGKRVALRVYQCLAALIAGVAIALNPWQAAFSPTGFAVSIAGMLLAGIGFEVLGAQKGVNKYNKTFWVAVITVVVGATASAWSGHVPFVDATWNVTRVMALIGFGAIGGLLYYLCNIVAIEKLPIEVATTIAMAETPVVIVFAWFMLGDTMTVVQWTGVLIALSATLPLLTDDSPTTE